MAKVKILLSKLFNEPMANKNFINVLQNCNFVWNFFGTFFLSIFFLPHISFAEENVKNQCQGRQVKISNII